jgi:hypothetical protein
MKMENVVMLKSDVLFGENGCPACGGDKSEKARVCQPCIQEIGRVATQAVNKVLATMCDAMIGNVAANSGNVVRGNIWGKPVLANLRLDKNATFHEAKGDIQAYWECRRTVKKRFVAIFIFGLDAKAEKGRELTGLVELKVKHVKNAAVHYLRVQAVQGVKSDVKLAVLNLVDSNKLDEAELGLPSQIFQTDGYDFAIGFLPVKTREDGADDATKTCACLR